MPASIAVLDRLRQVQVLRYGLASLGALAVDMACFLALLRLGMAPAPASAAGYAIGVGAHWLLSSRAVFVSGVASTRVARLRQQGLFVLSALVGLGVTTGIVGLGSLGGFDPRLAKIAAIGASFVVTWMLRKNVVFR